MAGRIEPHGNGYRVRWTNRLAEPGTPERRPQNGDLVSHKDAKLFKAWLEADGREFCTGKDDPAIVSGAWRTQVMPAGSGAPLSQTFGEYARAAIERANVFENTKVNRRRILLKFADWDDVRLTEIDRDLLVKKIRSFDQNPDVAATSAKTYLDFAHGLLRNAYLAKLMPINPFLQDDHGHPSKVSLGKAGRSARIRKRAENSIFLEPATISALCAAALEQETALMIRFMVGTGVRVSELFAMRTRNVRLGDHSLYVNRAILREPDGSHRYYEGDPKSWSIREVPLHSDLAKELALHVRGRGDADFLFPAPRGGFWQYENFSYRWRRIIKRAHERGLLDSRIEPTPHATRHTFASRAYNQGMSSFQISRFMGHMNERVTDSMYGHLGKDSAKSMRNAQGVYAEMDRDADAA